MKNGGTKPPFFFWSPLLPPALARWRLGRLFGRWGWRRRRCAVAGPEENPGRVAIKIVHRAADIPERTSTVGHQCARTLVEVISEFADRFHRLEQLAAILAARQCIQPQHEIIGLQ